jgi:hypothetical protein
MRSFDDRTSFFFCVLSETATARCVHVRNRYVPGLGFSESAHERISRGLPRGK